MTDITHVSAGSLSRLHARTDLTFTTGDQTIAIPSWANQVWVCYEEDTFYIGLATTVSNGPELPAGGYMWPVGEAVGRELHYRAKTSGGAGSVCFLP
jgi:hypothetical protein